MAALHTNPSLMGFQHGRNIGEQDNLLTVLNMEGWEREKKMSREEKWRPWQESGQNRMNSSLPLPKRAF